jgi:nucleotidyltransferase substrate binding protein (TIGR01987 family)
MKLDVSSLSRAVTALEKSLGFLHSDLAADNPDLREQFRAATIQGFEFVYELTFKMIRRQLEQIVAVPSELREMTFPDLMRTAADAGLIQDSAAWRKYRELRNRTSHTYDEAEAEAILVDLDAFLADIRFTRDELTRRNHEID